MFPELLKGEDWKIQRVINTSVNKMRNFGAVAYMNQAEVEHFIIRGVNDSRQCPYCAALQGKKFSVSKAFEKIEKATQSEPELIKEDTPFATSVFAGQEGIDELEGLTAEEIQDKGIDAPPFHPNCRDTIVADI